ncbi:MAG: biotin synthase [Rubrivivax sp.]
MDLPGSPIPPAAGARRPVQSSALARVIGRWQRADGAPWLHAEVARRMAERLSVIKLRPQVILDWEARVGGGRQALLAAYERRGPPPQVLPVESFPASAAGEAHPSDKPSGKPSGKPWWSPSRWRRAGPPALAPTQVASGSAQLVWSNMALHAVEDPSATIAQWHRALALDGFLMFSCLGPGSLPELRSLYAARTWGPPMAPLVDMHDLGDMLVAAGFADPVMDQEQIVLTWADATACLDELRTLGANVDPQRFAGLRTPRWRDQLLEALRQTAANRSDGRIALTFEVAYGHAFRPPGRARVTAESRVDLADFRAMARGRHR